MSYVADMPVHRIINASLNHMFTSCHRTEQVVIAPKKDQERCQQLISLSNALVNMASATTSLQYGYVSHMTQGSSKLKCL